MILVPFNLRYLCLLLPRSTIQNCLLGVISINTELQSDPLPQWILTLLLRLYIRMVVWLHKKDILNSTERLQEGLPLAYKCQYVSTKKQNIKTILFYSLKNIYDFMLYINALFWLLYQLQWKCYYFFIYKYKIEIVEKGFRLTWNYLWFPRLSNISFR